jgi:hypothetical protein
MDEYLAQWRTSLSAVLKLRVLLPQSVELRFFDCIASGGTTLWMMCWIWCGRKRSRLFQHVPNVLLKNCKKCQKISWLKSGTSRTQTKCTDRHAAEYNVEQKQTYSTIFKTKWQFHGQNISVKLECYRETDGLSRSKQKTTTQTYKKSSLAAKFLWKGLLK